VQTPDRALGTVSILKGSLAIYRDILTPPISHRQHFVVGVLRAAVHSWHFNFKPRGGPGFRFSLDAELNRHVASKEEAKIEAKRIRIQIRDGTFVRVAERRAAGACTVRLFISVTLRARTRARVRRDGRDVSTLSVASPSRSLLTSDPSAAPGPGCDAAANRCNDQ
jgi:hypothetical protein